MDNTILMKDAVRRKSVSKATALVVDDEINLCYLLKNLLSRLDYSVICEHTLADAMNSYEMNKPELTLLDIHLPDGLGIQLLNEIKSKHREAVVIMMSSERNFKNSQKRVLDKADYFLRKPFQLSDVKQVINQLSL